jgi:Na+/H+-dicarboxylate symporter
MPISTERAAQRRGQQLMFVALTFVALLAFPLLGLWDQPARLGGVPVLWVAVFGWWALLIGLTAWLVRHPATPKNSAPTDSSPHTTTPDRG